MPSKRQKDRQQQRRSCWRKIKYPARSEAEEGVRVMNDRHTDLNFRAYRCESCGQYHVGSFGR